MTLTVTHASLTGAAANPDVLVDGPKWDANHTITGSVDATQMPALTGDVTTSAGSTATTLATVNSNVGTFGSATQTVQVTFNAKGLATAASNVTVTPAIGSVTGLGTGVSTFLATPSSANLRAALTDEVGTGAAYFVGGALGTPASGTLTSCTAFTLTTTGTSGAATYSAGTLNIPQYAGGGVTSLNGQTGALIIPVLPGGRLTLTSGTPVMVSSVAGATTVYYTAYAGSYVPVYDGTNFVPTLITGGEISLATTDATKSPAAVAATSYYDVFVWSDSGTLRVSRGPAWTNATTRSAGTALTLVNGIYLNSVSITNGPAASRGTYVGTIGSNGSSTIDFIYPAISTSGTAGVFNVWNCYNRVDVAGVCGMSAVSWTYNVANVWRAQKASTTFNISVLRGLDEDGVSVNLLAQAQPPSGVNCACGIGLDSTTAATGRMMYVQSSVTQLLNMPAYYDGPPGLGFHTFYALELIDTATSSTFYGSGGVNYVQTGLGIRFRA
jgi:hypothetical protein